MAQNDDIEASFQQLADDIRRHFQFASVTLGVLDGDALRVRGHAADDPARQPNDLLADGLALRVAHSGVGELIAGAGGGDPTRRRGEVCVPITVDGRVYGVIDVEAVAPESPGAAEFDLLTTLAASLGIAIERGRRQASERRRMATLANLQYLTGRIVGRVRVTEEVGDILAEAGQLFDFRTITLGLLHADGLHTYQRYRDALGATPMEIRGYSHGVTGRVIRLGEPAFVHDVSLDPDYFADLPDVRQEICVPIRADGTLVGILDFEMDARRDLDDSDMDVALMLADHLGIAIGQQRRFESIERRNQQLRTLERVTALIAGKALVRDAFGEIAREIERAFEFGSAAIAVVNGDWITFPAIENRMLAGEQARWRTGFPVGAGVVGRVIASGQPAFVSDVRTDPDYLDVGSNVRSEICVPIVIDGRVVGAVNVETPVDRPIEPEDLEVLTIVANHIGIAIERSDLYEAELRSRREVEAMQRVSRIVASTLDSQEALRRIVETLAETFGYPFVSFLLVDGDRLRPAAWHGFPPEVFERSFALGQQIVGRVALTGQAIFVDDVAAEPDYSPPQPDANGEICVPIFCGETLAGVLNVEGTPARPLTSHDLTLLQTFAEHAGTLLHNARLFEQMRMLATHDTLTGLPNRRFFDEQLGLEVRRATRYRRPLALLLIDLDRFKAINDAHGHLVGDAVLRELASQMRALLRDTDLLARYAGDEFVALLPETNGAQARDTARRLQQALAVDRFPVPAGVSLSIGVACCPDDATTEQELLAAADRAMYAMKRRRDNPDDPDRSDRSEPVAADD